MKVEIIKGRVEGRSHSGHYSRVKVTMNTSGDSEVSMVTKQLTDAESMALYLNLCKTIVDKLDPVIDK